MTISWQAVLLLAGLLPVAGSCGRAPYRYQPLEVASAAGARPETPAQLLFLSFTMSTLPPGPRRIELLKAMAVPGEVNALPEDVTGPAYLVLTQLDAAGKTCGLPQRVPHPLVQRLEFPAGENSGRLERREASLPEAEFFVRLARQPRASTVRVEEVHPATPAPVAATFPLPI